jgi:UDP-N-acetylglucosamine--dolichyl-phosphate N-acetylglucosaminephosphotransferase
VSHLAVLVTVLATILLGFADDILDLQWRYKLLFPFFIIVPLVSVYAGPTHVEVIYPFSTFLGRTFELGPLYILYITLLGIYKTNTINIFAGINGLEVGQSIIAAAGMLLYFTFKSIIDGTSNRYHYAGYLLACFLGGALALLKLNQYPSRVFVGDTFCYFAGSVLAIAAILGMFWIM